MVHEAVLRAFDGTLETLEVVVRIRNARKSIFVGFGELRVPAVKVVENLGEIEKKHECRIKRMGGLYVVVPNVVGEIIKRDGVLCSICDEHREKLRKWMKEHGAFVVKKLLEG
ncbi:MAG TPA: hypothetical protein ENG66_07535 [Thermococcus sp.]|nr:MAG: hypothetical protein DRP04_10665 [Archaeoglobales archaeon]HDH45214.1 hypothetical protein [Thermococcus sp.]